MKYQVQYTPVAIKQLKKMDDYTRKLIYAWIDKNVQGCNNPREQGKGLTANHSGQWRYRIGDYRIIAEIQDEKVIVLIVNIGHRKEIYKNRG
ncbi:MAG TPA: type II toxin-antitoxin system RelE/ParE family toxin [Sedimentibacter sp.]|nr:type II toxin-antitoxin system RelE/ParE family toxin [Sedimentibacter sp.]